MANEMESNNINFYVPSLEALKYRKEFYSTTKLIDEKSTEWYKRVQDVGNKCEFGGLYDYLIIDKFVSGLSDCILQSITEGTTIKLEQLLSIALGTQEIGQNTKQEQFDTSEYLEVNSNCEDLKIESVGLFTLNKVFIFL